MDIASILKGFAKLKIARLAIGVVGRNPVVAVLAGSAFFGYKIWQGRDSGAVAQLDSSQKKTSAH